jgi:hypothetical protein
MLVTAGTSWFLGNSCGFGPQEGTAFLQEITTCLESLSLSREREKYLQYHCEGMRPVMIMMRRPPPIPMKDCTINNRITSLVMICIQLQHSFIQKQKK